MKKLFDKITDIGIYEDLPYLEKLRTKIFNQGAIFVILGTFLSAMESLVKAERGVYLLLIYSFCPLIALLLHKYKKYILARLYMTAFLPSMVFIFLIIYGERSGLAFTFFAFAIAILIGHENKRIITFNMIYILLLLVVGMTYINSHEPILGDTMDFKDALINTSLTILVISWGVYEFFEGVKNQEKILKTQKEELQIKNEELELLNNQNKTKTELLGIIAHDLRESANSFKNLTKKLSFLMKKNDPEQIVQLANYFEKSGEKLFFNLDNLLNWVISQKDRMEVAPREFLLYQTVRAVLKGLNFPIREKEISVVNNIDRSLIIFTDENMLKTVVHNLIQNALKYSPAKSSIVLESKRITGAYELSITDFGQGMKEDLINKLENNFAPMNKIKKNSFGLGLQICFFLTKKMNAKLSFDSEIGKGTTVALRLPEADPNEIRAHWIKQNLN